MTTGASVGLRERARAAAEAQEVMTGVDAGSPSWRLVPGQAPPPGASMPEYVAARAAAGWDAVEQGFVKDFLLRRLGVAPGECVADGDGSGVTVDGVWFQWLGAAPWAGTPSLVPPDQVRAALSCGKCGDSSWVVLKWPVQAGERTPLRVLGDFVLEVQAFEDSCCFTRARVEGLGISVAEAGA